MQAPVFIPPPIKNTQKCDRCGLQYPIEEKACSHCKDLTDQQVNILILKSQEEQKGNSNLGKLFIYAAIALGLAMLLLSY